MAGIPKEHEELYFDKLCRTQKAETVLSLIQATYHAKRSGTNDIKAEIAKRLESAYNLFRDNVKNHDSGSGTYNGSMKQFESQYTIGHELCIWKNSNLDLTDLATEVAKNNITIKNYFDIFFLNYFQPVSGKGIHPLYALLTYLKNNNSKKIDKNDIPTILNVKANIESINALCNFLDGTSYFKYDGNTLTYICDDPVDELLKKCNTKYIGVEGLQLAYKELNTDELYAEYITSKLNLTNESNVLKFSPEWFYEKGQLLLSFDTEAKPYYEMFQKRFNKDALLKLVGEDLLNNLFLCGNQSNMCYLLEYEPNYHRLFGSIKGGNAFKYPLHMDSSTGSWATGTQKNPNYLSINDAISYGTKIRDLLIKSLEIVEASKSSLNSVEDYLELSRELEDNVSELMGSIWFSKYLHLMYPDLFPVFHNRTWHDKVLEIIGEETDERAFCRIGKIEIFVHKCNISNVVFSQVIYQYCNVFDDSTKEENIESSTENSNDIVEENILPDESKRVKGGENVIVYGVPGAGKSHLVKYEYLNGDENEEYYERLVFHPDYTYSDFVGQIMPIVDKDKNVTYDFIPGPFTRLLKKAYRDSEHKYSLVIEEINRGNAAAIFGDIFQLLDRKTNGESDYRITNKDIARAVYGDNRADEKIYIPSNMSIICTMNTSDQNVFTLDTAFQRRWIMRLVSNSFEGDTSGIGNVEILDSGLTWEQFCETINDEILNKSQSLSSSEDKRLGTHFVRAEDLRYDNNENSENTNLKIKAQHQNRLFAEKVIKYLWDDVYKYDRTSLFDSDYKSLEQVINDFIKSSHIERFNIFKQDIRESLKKIADDNDAKKKNQNSESNTDSNS